MPRGTLVVDEKLLRDHFLRQKRGGNITGYRGARFQRGYGIGGIFKSLARYAIPLFKQSAKVVGKRALQAATEVGQDVLRGKNVRESVKTHGGTLLKTLPNKEQKPSYNKQGAESSHVKAATTMKLIAKLLKQVTIYIRSIKITKTPIRYALRSRPY
jgi:hypothetical protein